MAYVRMRESGWLGCVDREEKNEHAKSAANNRLPRAGFGNSPDPGQTSHWLSARKDGIT